VNNAVVSEMIEFADADDGAFPPKLADPYKLCERRVNLLVVKCRPTYTETVPD